jgi:hypothetical protein
MALQVGAYLIIFGTAQLMLSHFNLEDRKTAEKD